MLGAMHYEPFYRRGTYSDDRMNVRLGWVTHANSFSDCMPAMNEKRDLVLVFYGEDFSGSSAEAPFSANGEDRLRDARHVLRLYEKQGEDFLTKLNGWFTGVLLDLNRRKTVLFNDRYGMQRLYYHESEDALFFSSEAKALLRVIPSSREINLEALGEYAAFDCVLDSKSLFRGISVLPSGSRWSFDQAGRCNKGQYFKPRTLESDAPIRGGDDSVERLKRVFTNILPRYFQSSEPLALSLTGGLDTRLILAAWPDAERMPAYTFAGARDTFDVRQSRRVARARGLTHSVIRLGAKFFETLPELAEDTIYISDGTLGVGGSHNLYLNRLARQIAPVRLTGLFGSEVLREKAILPRAVGVDGLLHQDFLNYVKEAQRSVVTYRQGDLLTAALHRDIPWRS